MAIIPIYNSFHPVLKKKTEAVKEIDGKLKELIDNMFITMYHADGIGLAANQVGVSQSFVIIDVSASSNKNIAPLVMINPVIKSFSDEEVDFSEGCLSVPKFFETVVRPKNIQVRYFDMNMKEHNEEVDDILSRVMQHEIDHLNGILFYERLSPIKRTLSKSKLKKIQRGKVIPKYPMILANGKLVE